MKLLTMMGLALVLGCSDGGTGGSDGSDGTADTAPDTIDAPDAPDTTDTTPGDGGGDGVTPIEEPILERASSGAYDCVVEREMTRVEGAEYRFDAIVAAGDRAIGAYAYPRLALVPIAVDGAVGSGVELDATDYSSSQATLAYDGSSVAVVWLRDGGAGAELRFARVAGADLAVEVASKALLVGSAGYETQPVLVARAGGGWALLYAASGAGGDALSFVRLDRDGALVGDAATVRRGGGADAIGFAPAITAAPGGGWALMWTEGSYQAGEVFFARIDEAGAVVAGPARISVAGGEGVSSGVSFRAPQDALVAVGDRYWAAFTETHTTGGEDFLDQKIAVFARVAIVDGEGNGALHRLQAPVEDVTVVSPSLHPMGGGIGVLWSGGSVIYICAGCITDYDMHFVLLDPDGATPVADPVAQLHDANGFTDPRGVLIGGALLTTTALDFHALSYPATGVFGCQRR